MGRHDMSVARQKIAAGVGGGVGNVPHVGVDLQVGGIHGADEVHGLGDRIAEIILHGLQRQHDPVSGGPLGADPQTLDEALPRFGGGAFMIIYVVACQLDDPHPQPVRQTDGLLHNVHASRTDLGNTASHGILAVAAEAHCLNGKPHRAGEIV